MEEVLGWLRKQKACAGGYLWSKQFETPKEWWDSFERPDWMLWVIQRLYNWDNEDDVRKITLVKVEIAKLVKHRMKDPRSLKALETGERYAKGEVALKDLKDAAAVAANVAATAYATAAYYAVDAAADAGDTVAYAAYAADDTDAAKHKTQKQSVDIVRKYYKIDEILRRLKGSE